MYIESIRLNNFRNYELLEMNFDQGTNILYGDNAQGKTNILEAVYLAGTSKSHKGSKDREMIRFENEESHIRMMVKKGDLSYKIDMHLRKNKAKGVAINGLPNQRNRLLKDCYMNPGLKSTLDIWDMQMADYGKKIIEKREEFVEELNELAKGLHKGLTGGLEELELLYEPSVTAAEFEQKLAQNRDRDLRMKLTSVGPHRDDFCVKVNGIDIRKYGSQGQQRTAALSLKLSEIYLVKKKIKDTPVLLLDDVLSELDSNRQTYLLESIHDIQTLITCTGLDDFVSHQFEINRVFQVIKGHVYMPKGF